MGSVRARALVWDANGAAAPDGADGSGGWDVGTTDNWYDPLLPVNVTWVNGDSAYLGNAGNDRSTGTMKSFSAEEQRWFKKAQGTHSN